MGLSHIFLLALLAVGEDVAANSIFCPSETTLATFNIGLVPFFPSPTGNPELEERVTLLIEELQASDIDIVCLQEVFFADFQRQIYAALNDVYPYAFTATDLSLEENDPTPACTLSQIQTFGVCVAVNCSGLEADILLACAVVNCSSVLDTQVCVDCASLYFQLNAVTECLTLPTSRFERNYGLMILSRKELTDTRASGYTNQSQFDGYLEASVAGVGDLVCTHLSSVESTRVYYGPPIVSPPLFTNYAEQQYNEVLTLLELATTKEIPILIGDFNSGPAPPGNRDWSLPFHYGLINARGFISPYMLEDGRCTTCASNPTISSTSMDRNLDHVYITTDTYKERVVSAKRIFAESVTDGGVPISDHYGVRLTLRDTRSNCRWWERRRYYCPAEPRLRLLHIPPPPEGLRPLCETV